MLRLIVVLIIMCAASSAQAAPKSVKSADTGITRTQADQILDELRQIRQLLEGDRGPGGIANELRLLRQAFERQQAPAAQPAAPAAPQQPMRAKVNIGGLPVLGRGDAPLTMVEFLDYQCPFCRAFDTDTFAEIKKNWIDTGKLRFVSWDLPLEFHANAAKAAQAARCAGEQNKYWELRKVLIANAAKLAPEEILGHARQIPGLDLERFKTCASSDRYADAIRKSVAEASSQGISGTPTFLISKTDGDTVDGVLLVGAQPYASFDAQLRQQLGR